LVRKTKEESMKERELVQRLVQGLNEAKKNLTEVKPMPKRIGGFFS
jgi:hypothetical protein